MAAAAWRRRGGSSSAVAVLSAIVATAWRWRTTIAARTKLMARMSYAWTAMVRRRAAAAGSGGMGYDVRILGNFGYLHQVSDSV